MTNDPNVERFDAARLVERACIPPEDRERALKIGDDVMKRKFGGYSDEGSTSSNSTGGTSRSCATPRRFPSRSGRTTSSPRRTNTSRKPRRPSLTLKPSNAKQTYLRAEGRFEAEPETDRDEGGIEPGGRKVNVWWGRGQDFSFCLRL